MKNTKKFFVIVAIVLMMLIGTSLTAFASGSGKDANYPYSTNHKLAIDSGWKEIASSDTGFNCKVYIYTINYTTANNDIIMFDADYNVVWYEEAAITMSNSRTFDCGSNVHHILIRTQLGTGHAFARYAGEL